MKKKSKDLIIKKPSAMIQTTTNGITVLQRKFINIMIHIAQKTGDKSLYYVDIVDLKKMCKISTVGNDEIISSLKGLQDIKIEYNIFEKDKEKWGRRSLIGDVEIEINKQKNNSFLEFEIPVKMKNKILNPTMYAPLDIYLIAGFKSAYTIILYEFLRDYLTAPKVKYLTITQFRKIMSLSDNKYKEFKYLKRDVLDKAVSEINKKSDLETNYTFAKKGRKYIGIQFFVSKKKMNEYPIEIIPDEIIKILPEKYRTTPILNLISKILRKENVDINMIQSNIKYSIKNAKSNFIAYLKQSLVEDYAQQEREEKEKISALIHKKEIEKLRELRNEEKKKRLGEELYNSLKEEELLKYEEEIKLQFKLQNVPPEFVSKLIIKNGIIEKLLSEKESKQAGNQEDLF